MMLDTHELRRIVAECSYRPGWNLDVFEHLHEGPHLRVTATVPNAYDPDEPTDLGINCAIPPAESVEQFLRWLAWRVGRIEMHEALEWLRRNGRPVVDPHGPDYLP